MYKKFVIYCITLISLSLNSAEQPIQLRVQQYTTEASSQTPIKIRTQNLYPQQPPQYNRENNYKLCRQIYEEIDIEEIKKTLIQGANPSIKFNIPSNRVPRNAIDIAIQEKHLEAAQLLYENYPDLFNVKHLAQLVSYKDEKWCKFTTELLTRFSSAAWNDTEIEDLTLLDLAIKAKNITIIKKLIDEGFKIKGWYGVSENFFINLIKLDLESAKKVVDQKLHIFGLPTLHQLYEETFHSNNSENLDKNMAEITSQLLKIRYRCIVGTNSTPFVMPIMHGWPSVVKILLNNNIVIPTLVKNSKEITCLELALNTNQLAIAKLLWPHTKNISYTTAAQYFGKVFRKQIYCGLATLLLLSTGGIIYYVNL